MASEVQETRLMMLGKESIIFWEISEQEKPAKRWNSAEEKQKFLKIASRPLL
jgi:hypothetical protein